MEDLKIEEFKKNPVLYILFLPLLALVFLFMLNKNISEERITTCEAEKAEMKKAYADLVLENKELVKLLVQKQTLDSLRK